MTSGWNFEKNYSASVCCKNVECEVWTRIYHFGEPHLQRLSTDDFSRWLEISSNYVVSLILNTPHEIGNFFVG
ncbi:hypothetical protein HPGCJGGD_1532 [Methylobacterium haplocladii]|nr:hypothetical protein HPGCJGGD_1532 [Methylobacterium haplocladii]